MPGAEQKAHDIITLKQGSLNGTHFGSHNWGSVEFSMINGLIKFPLFYKSMAILRDFPKITMHEVSVGIIMTPVKVKANIHTHQ